MATELNIYGLCSTCNNRPECLSFQNSMQINRPVLYCEEFDNFVPGMDIDADENEKNDSYRPSDHLNEIIPGRTMGLCINCEDRKTCMLPSPTGGVLYCEEHYCLPLSKQAGYPSEDGFYYVAENGGE